MKVCTKCGNEKHRGDFYKNESQCKRCRTETRQKRNQAKRANKGVTNNCKVVGCYNIFPVGVVGQPREFCSNECRNKAKSNCIDCEREFKSSGHKRCDYCRPTVKMVPCPNCDGMKTRQSSTCTNCDPRIRLGPRDQPPRRFLEAFGETKGLAQWSRDPRCVVSEDALKARITREGWPPELAITAKVGYRLFERETKCSECGKIYISKQPTPLSNNEFCSQYCRNQRLSVTRRALEEQAFVDDINRELLFDSYDGLCVLCHLEISLYETWWLEHILPLSRGGKHEWINVAPSHEDCNRSKTSKTFTEYIYKSEGFTFYE